MPGHRRYGQRGCHGPRTAALPSRGGRGLQDAEGECDWLLPNPGRYDPGFAEASGGIFISVTGLPDGTVRNMVTFMGKLRGMQAQDPLAFEVCVRHVASVIEDQRRKKGLLTRATPPPVDTRAPLAHSASSVSAQRVSVTAAKQRSSARPAPARLARHRAAQRLAGCRRRHQSLASFAHGSVIRIRRAPKSMTKVASSSILMTRPRPYLSCVTWSCSANCSAGGAGGAGPKGLVGRRRRVAARAGSITTSMRPRRWP